MTQRPDVQRFLSKGNSNTIYTNKGTVRVCVCLSGFLHEIQGFCKLHISCCFSYAAVISDNIYLGKMPAIISDYIFQIMYY